MLLPVGAAFRALAARTVEFALAAIFSVVPPRPVKLRTVATIELRTIAPRTFGACAARLEVPLLAAFAVEPRRTRPVAELPVRDTAFAALATRRAITTIEFWTVATVELRTIAALEFGAVAARLEIALFAAGAVV